MYHLNIKLDPENKTLIEVKWSETKFQFKNYDQSNNKFSFSQKPNKPINIFFFFTFICFPNQKKKKPGWEWCVGARIGSRCGGVWGCFLRRRICAYRRCNFFETETKSVFLEWYWKWVVEVDVHQLGRGRFWKKKNNKYT